MEWERLKRILVIRSQHLVAMHIEYLLKRVEEFSVESIQSSDIGSVVESVELFQPEVIVMNSSLPISEISWWSKVLDRFDKLRIIIVHNDTNQIELFEKRELTLTSGDDLVETVRQG